MGGASEVLSKSLYMQLQAYYLLSVETLGSLVAPSLRSDRYSQPV